MKTITGFLLMLLAVCVAHPAQAQTAQNSQGGDVKFFALLVGSNLPGENQTPLRYAHRDMEKVGAVLTEIGKYHPRRISRLADPTAKALQIALNRIKAQLAGLPDSTQSRFVFYYSGHAKSNALNLGKDSVSLKELRRMLVDIPSVQKIIILDACQSGSFSRVKGVSVTDDFSHNSRATLETRGTAVLASSSAEELSQESDELKGSIFTHNLVTGLRGAADADTNGRVSLFEAYDYAYSNTLIASADTRVGRQHVTLETNLKGTGETVLTWPAASSAKLVLPKEVHGTVVVYEVKSNTIHAEIHKAKGSAITLAFPPGKYGVVITGHKKALNCPVELKTNSQTRLAQNSCQATRLKSGVAKHDTSDPSSRYRFTPFMAFQFGIQFLRKDAFIRRLERVGFASDEFNKPWEGTSGNEIIPYGEALVGILFNQFISLGFLYSTMNRFDFREQGSGGYYNGGTDQYKWVSHRFNLQFRFQFPVLFGRIVPHVFIDSGAGLVNDELNSTSFQTESGTSDMGKSEQRFWGPVLGGGLGVNIKVFKRISVVSQLKYIYAPIMENGYNERQNAGGWIVTSGIRIGQ